MTQTTQTTQTISQTSSHAIHIGRGTSEPFFSIRFPGVWFGLVWSPRPFWLLETPHTRLVASILATHSPTSSCCSCFVSPRLLHPASSSSTATPRSHIPLSLVTMSSSNTPSLPKVDLPSTEELKEDVKAASKSSLQSLRSLVAGGVGGVCAVVVGHPFDLVKVRMQTAEKGVYNGAIDVVRKTIAREGLARVRTGTPGGCEHSAH